MSTTKQLRRNTWWESLMLRHETHTPRPDWHQQAKCKNTDPNLFHTETNFETAYNTCLGCPVILDCGAEAHTHETDATYFYGVWGGVPPWYRRRWHQATRRAQKAAKQALSA